MNRLQKLVSILSVSTVLLTASCSSIGYRAVTFQPCIPEDSEEISERRMGLIKETIKDFSVSSYETQERTLTPGKDYIEANWKFMEF